MTHRTSTAGHQTITLLLALAGLVLATGCRRSSETPRVGEQPVWHHERSPATMPTVTSSPAHVRAPESTDDPDSLGTVRTPPAAHEEAMDNP